MTQTIKKLLDGTLEITNTGATTINIMARNDVIGKIAEAQTKVDHLQIDLTVAQAEVVKWDNQLKELDK